MDRAISPFTRDSHDYTFNRALPTIEGQRQGLGSSLSSFYDESLKKKTSSENLAGGNAIRSASQATKKKLRLSGIDATGVSKSMNPTNVRVHVKWQEDDNDPNSKVNEQEFLWRSRDNRKGRNSIILPPSYTVVPPARERFTSGVKDVGRNIYRMFTSFPYWDMSFWSGWAYTWGSVLFVIDGALAVQGLTKPDSMPEEVGTYGIPMFFFIGAIFYQIGATMAYLEAVNDGSFQGSAMRRFLEGHEQDSKQLLDAKIHRFFGHLKPHRSQTDVSALERQPSPARRGAVDMGEAEEGTVTTYYRWRWWPTWRVLREHHAYELGYLACAIQLFGATLYGVTAVVALPGILSAMDMPHAQAAYWGPQILASCCFLTASVLFTLETQTRWWRPEPASLGWWIGFWAAVGSTGFLLCGIFGCMSYWYEFGEYQADVSSTWGSTCFLIGSALQWYEATNKRPVDELFNEAGAMKSFQVHPI